MSLTAVKILIKEFPKAKIYLVTKDYLKDIFLNIPEIYTVVTIPDQSGIKHFFRARKKLRALQFELGILLTNSFQSALLFRIAGIKRLIGYSKEGRGFMLTEKRKFPGRLLHYVGFYTRIIDLLTGEKTPVTSYLLRPVFTRQEREAVLKKLKGYGISSDSRIIGINPGAAYGSAKAWGGEKFASLIKLICSGKILPQVLLFGSPREKNLIDDIQGFLSRDNSCSPQRGRILNLAGKLTLRESLAAVSFCQALVANDSGFMHVAASLDIPVVAIYGPTDPELSKPLNQGSRIIHKPADCAPCKYRECPVDHRCMNSIGAEEVFAALESIREAT